MKIEVVANLKKVKAEAMRSDIEVLERDCKEILTVLDTLNSKYWKGDDATSFIRKYNDDILPTLTGYIKSFRKFQDYQSKVPAIFVEVDNSYKDEIKF